MGADPVAYAIARESLDAPPPIQAFSVRKAAKQHGTRAAHRRELHARRPGGDRRRRDHIRWLGR